MKILLAAPLRVDLLSRMAGGSTVLRTPDATPPTITHICTDSREADENTLLCAIRGERVDGHRFIPGAAKAGCRAFLCERLPEGWERMTSESPMGEGMAAAILVPDTVEALSRLARARREDELTSLRITAVTGSVGKTTTKEMIAAVLSTSLSLFKKDGNFNSTIGLPLSFMEIPAPTEAAVLEMGMSARGEISAMTNAVCPDIAVIANIGTSHMEYLGSRESIARAKLEIAEGVREGGTLLVNGDEPLLSDMGELPAGVRVLRLSLQGNPHADYTALNITARDGGMCFDLQTPEGLWSGLCVPALGEHLVWAASFAAAVGQLHGLDEGQVKAGLKAYRPADMRQNTCRVGDVTVIKDCYNAAPESMRAALGVLAMTAGTCPPARRIAVLGDMKELGEDTVALHRGVGATCASSGVDLLVTVGELGAEIARGAMEAGLSPEHVLITGEADTYPATATRIREMLRAGDVLLFKASRSMALETIADAVIGELNEKINDHVG